MRFLDDVFHKGAWAHDILELKSRKPNQKAAEDRVASELMRPLGYC